MELEFVSLPHVPLVVQWHILITGYFYQSEPPRFSMVGYGPDVARAHCRNDSFGFRITKFVGLVLAPTRDYDKIQPMEIQVDFNFHYILAKSYKMTTLMREKLGFYNCQVYQGCAHFGWLE